MKKNLWVKLAALALALTLLWMNMADVRNIVNANAEANDGGSVELAVEKISFDQETVSVDGSVTITVTTNRAAEGVTITLGTEDSGETEPIELDPDEDKTSWTKELSVSGWTAGIVYVASATVQDTDENAIECVVGEDGAAVCTSADNAKYSFAVEEKPADSEDEDDDTSRTFTVGDIAFDRAEAMSEDTVTLRMTTSSAAKSVVIVFGWEAAEETKTVDGLEAVSEEGDESGTKWKYELPVGKYPWAVGTKVYVSSVTATDADGKNAKGEVSESGDNKYSASAENAKYSFTVVDAQGNSEGDGDGTDDPDEPVPGDGEKKDVDTPVIGEEIKLDKQGQTLKDGETVTISGTAYDMGSGIDRIEIQVSGYRKGTIYAGYDADTREWKAVLTVSKENFYNRKKIYITSVKAVDKGELYKNGIVSTSTYNNTVAYEDNALYWFAIEREELDAPKVESVTLKENGATVTPGDSIEVQVQVSAGDAELRDKDGCSVELRCTKIPSNYNWNKYLYLDWDPEKECYSGSMEITGAMYPGEWKLYSADVYEVSNGEWSAWYYPPEDITFTIQNDDYDVEVPKVKSLQMDKRGEFVSEGEAVQLSVEATDNKGIDCIRVDLYAVENRLTSKGGEKSIYLERVGDSDRYEGSFEIDEKTFPCEWYVDCIYIEDTARNYQFIHSCQDGVYSTDYYYEAFSKDSYSLEEHFYVNVGEEKNFLQPTVSGYIFDFSESGDYYNYQKSVDIPRRTTLSEMKKLLGEGAGHDGVSFEGWEVSYCSSDESEDPVVLWKKANAVYAKYDKTVICLSLSDMDGNLLYRDVIFGEENKTLALPKDITGLCNIEWEGYVDGEWIAVDNIIVTSEPVQYVSGSAELDPDNPATPPAPTTPDAPDTPVRPPYTEPVALPGQKIAEVVAEIAAAGNGATITVAMGDATVVPKDILEAAKGKDVDVVLQMDGYTWTINGKDILSENLKDINLRVIRNTEYIPSGLISRLAGDNPVEQITLEYDGDFGFKADLTMNIGSQHAGKSGNLYWHDSDGRMIFMNAGAIDAAGNVTLGFSHASDYAIVITSPAATIVPNTAAASVSTSAATTPKTGDELPVVPYAAVCAVGFVGILIAGVVIKKRRGK